MRPTNRGLPALRICLEGPAALVVAVLAGCGFGDAPLDAVDPDAAPRNPNYTVVSAILERSCAPCHEEGDGEEGDRLLASFGAAPPRIFAEPDLSTCNGIQGALAEIHDTVLQSGSMPPGAWPRLSEEEKLTLQRWLDQGACSPCSSGCP